MAIKTNVQDPRPASEKYRREVTLLSRGFFNKGAFPDGKIVILPWDSAVDDWLARRVQKTGGSGRSLLFNILPRVCDLNGCKVEDFIASEVMLVLMVSRSILNSDAVTYDAICPSCDFRSPVTLKIPEQLERVGEKPADYQGYDVIILPECKDVIHARPLTIRDELAVTSRPDDVRQRTLPDKTAGVLAGITSVGGGQPENHMELVTWFKSLPPSDSEFLIGAFDKIQPELSRVVKHECDECGHAFEHVLQLNSEFFRRGSSSEPRSALAPAVHAGVPEQGTKPRSAKGARPDPAKPT